MAQTVLLVDDVPAVTAALKRRMRMEPFRILEASSADEALRILATQSVDVLVSDDAMPGTTGSELMARVYQAYPETVCMLLTGCPTVVGALRAINEGHVYRILTKPCDPAQLASFIRQALREKVVLAQNRHLARELEEQGRSMRALEAAHPGITHVDRDEDDAVILG